MKVRTFVAVAVALVALTPAIVSATSEKESPLEHQEFLKLLAAQAESAATVEVTGGHLFRIGSKGGGANPLVCPGGACPAVCECIVGGMAACVIDESDICNHNNCRAQSINCPG